MFCNEWATKQHMKEKHCFPPFPEECLDAEQLAKYVEKKICKEYKCVFCSQIFGNEDSVKQHMIDLGHSKLNLEKFAEFEKFYLWKIEETSSEEEAELL